MTAAETTGTVASVVVDVRPIGEPLDYAVPSELRERVTVGTLVRVPLQGRKVRGWVVAVSDTPTTDAALRPVAAVVTDVPVASPTTLRLAAWAARDYAGSTASVLSWATPAPLPRGRPAPPPTRPASASVPTIPTISAAMRDGIALRAFVRSWPADDGAATIGPIADALPPGRALLVVAPAGAAPVLDGAVDLVRATTDAARTAAWQQATSGAARIVVTGRHGPLVPVPNLGGVVVTREHSAVHKDERTPTLDARVVARRLASDLGVPFVAIGPTSPLGPEGVLYCDASGDRTPVDTAPHVTEIAVPGAAARWPQIEVTSLRDDTPGTGALGGRFFSAVRETLTAGGAVLVFLNRTGTARASVCRVCGASASCDVCGALLRPGDGVLECPAGHAPLPFTDCPSCGSSKVRRVGLGVSGLRRELTRAFPGVEVSEASGDDVPDPLPGGVCVGTQAALRHRGAFDLVVLVDPDAMLGAPGLRADEAAFALLLDAVATARPQARGGRVLVQTRRPDHAAMRAFVLRDPTVFEHAVLARREPAHLPPYRRMLAVSSPDAGIVDAFAAALSPLATVFGPAPEPGPHLLALVDDDVWDDAVTAVRAVVAAEPGPRVRVEVDPLVGR